MEPSELIEAYKPLACKLASTYYRLEFEDRYQEAMLGLVIAAKTFDEGKGVQFAAYLRRILTNRLTERSYKWKVNSAKTFTEVEAKISGRRGSDARETSIEELIEDPKSLNPYEAFDFLETVKTVWPLLSEVEQRVVRLRLQGKDQRQIASELDSSQPTIHRILAHVKEVYARESTWHGSAGTRCS